MQYGVDWLGIPSPIVFKTSFLFSTWVTKARLKENQTALKHFFIVFPEVRCGFFTYMLIINSTLNLFLLRSKVAFA